MKTAVAELMIAEEVRTCRTDPIRFNETILGRGPYWSRQRELCRSILHYRTTCAPTGNGVGKSYLAAGLVAWFATRGPCKVVVAAPTEAQLTGVVWAELEAAYHSARRDGIPLGGRLRPLSWDLGPNWRVEGFGSGSVESKSGRHAGELLAVVDEASGVAPGVLEAIDSLNPSKLVYFGNPLRPDGKFYELCEQSSENPHVNVIRIPSTESPHIDRPRSPFGLADATWLESSRAEYGEASIWWLCHVLAQFPDSATDSLIPRDWLELAERTIHVREGPTRMGIDLSKGNGGDKSAICVRDDTGILALEASNRWDLAATAARASLMREQWQVSPGRITYDANGLGDGFGRYLGDVGIFGAKAYLGSNGGGPLNANLRTACAWAFRQRLNPEFSDAPHGPGVLVTRSKPFAIPPHVARMLRAQLRALRYELTPGSGKALETKAEFCARIKHSPDESDALFMTFAFPHA